LAWANTAHASRNGIDALAAALRGRRYLREFNQWSALAGELTTASET
jgi:hypothetical protein